MNTVAKTLAAMAWCCCVAGVADAQQARPAGTPQSEAGEPRADTSDMASPQAVPAAPAAGATAGAAAAATAGRPPGKAPKPAPQAAAAGTKPSSKSDRLDLGTATVTGDREQPKVMYIVPWKKSDIGDLAGKPMNSLVDEILAPVDRDVFKREVVYYHAVQSDASQNGALLKPAQQGEK
jgi:hypothetical protein